VIDPQERPLVSIDEWLEAVPGWPRGRSATYAAASKGDLPSIRLNGRLYLITAELLALIGLAPESDNGAPHPGPVASASSPTTPAATRGGQHEP
jgi:hypothetical protein